jgi:large subunit ribosomal protein L15
VTAEIRLQELAKVDAEVVDLEALLSAGLISKNIKRVKVIDSGKIEKAVSVKGLRITKGARAAIEAVGGKVLED